ncbi:hypothetical protein [Streptomyces sp. NPDC053728]|uniref:hypothetical protein n=1 Tax=Streptomyces sp. NPDC053728 TaxID=3155534 RepID=UPI00344917CD
MRPARSRKALKLAEKHLELLEEVSEDTQEFTDVFVPSVAMIRRVGHAIDVESKGVRTHQFGEWWSQSKKNSLLRCVTDVRNLVFRAWRRERRSSTRCT